MNRDAAAPGARGRGRRGGSRSGARTRFVAGASDRPPGPPRSRRTSTIPAPATSPSTSCVDGLPRGGTRSRRWRRRHPAHRDDLRHAQRQGRDLRASRRSSRSWAQRLPVIDQRHHHRPLRAHALGPDRRRVLEQRPPRAAARRRPQLRARRAGMLRPYVAGAVAASPTRTSRVYPNAGLPNAFGGYDETPAETSAVLGELADEGVRQPRRRLLRHHARRTSPPIAAVVAGLPPRVVPSVERRTRLSGLEPLDIGPDIALRQRRRAHQRHRLAALRPADPGRPLRRGGRGRAPAGRERRPDDRHQHGRGLLDSEAAMTRFLNLIAAEPDIARCPSMIDSSKWSVIEAGLQARPGAAGRQLGLAQGGRGGVPAPGAARAPLRRGGDRHGLRRAGPGRHGRAQGRHRASRLSAC